MISQELFSEVLGIEVFEVDSHVVENRLIGFYSRKNMYESAFTEQTYHTKHACWLQHINIYELGNKCKEWAWERGVLVEICRNENGFKCVLISRFNMDFSNTLLTYNESVNCMVKTEMGAVIKACQWILDNKEK